MSNTPDYFFLDGQKLTATDNGDGTKTLQVSGGGGGGSVTIADGADVTQGAQADAVATTDTGTFSIVSLIKRGLTNWTTLLDRVPAQTTPGLLPVDTLGTPGTPRVQATTSSAAAIVLTSSCRRVSMFATQGAWYSISGSATITSHFIGTAERIDIDVPSSTTISVLRDSIDGSIRITELT